MLSADVARCADAAGCPLMATCLRSVPPEGERVVYALFNALRESRGFCGHYLEAV